MIKEKLHMGKNGHLAVMHILGERTYNMDDR